MYFYRDENGGLVQSSNKITGLIEITQEEYETLLLEVNN